MQFDEGCFICPRAVPQAIFNNEKWFKVWWWCLREANFKDKEISIMTGRGVSSVTVKRGQFVFGRNKHSKELNMAPSTLWKIILKFKKDDILNIKSDNHYSIITFCNYNEIQTFENYSGTTKVTGKEQASDRQVTGKEHIRTNETNGKKGTNKNTVLKPENASDQTWNDFITHRKNIKASVTQTVINSFIKESKKANISLEDALIESITRGWRGFKAEWMLNKSKQNGSKNLDIFKP